MHTIQTETYLKLCGAGAWAQSDGQSHRGLMRFCAGARAWLKPFPMASYGVVALWPPTFCHMLIWTSA